jgi:hypothetical protein
MLVGSLRSMAALIAQILGFFNQSAMQAMHMVHGRQGMQAIANGVDPKGSGTEC